MGKYETIIKIAECGSLTKAAAEIGYNQSSLSYIVNSIEEELGVKLFLRDHKGSGLTDAGKEIIEVMKKIEKLEVEMHDISAFHHAGILKVAAFPSIEIAWLPGVLRSFRELYPETKVIISQLKRYIDLEPGLKEGLFDCGFFVGKHQPAFDFFPLYKEDYYIAVSEDWDLAEKDEVSIEELADYVFIPPSESAEPGAVRSLAQKLTKSETLYIQPGEDTATIAMVEQGFGISIFPKLLLNQLAQGKRIKAVPIKETVQRNIGILCRSYEETTDVTRAFIRLSKEYIEQWK